MRVQRVYHRVFGRVSGRLSRGLILGAAAALILGACNRSKDEEADDKEPGSGDEAAGSGGAAAAAGEMPAGASYANFPADSEMLFGVSFTKVTNSAIWSKYRDAVIANIDDDGEFESVVEACGFDPLTKLDSVMVGGTTVSDDLVVVVHGLGRDEVRTCAEGVAASEEKELTITDEGNLSYYQQGDEGIWVAWLDDRTLLTGPSADSDKEWIEARAAGQEGLEASSGLAQLVEGTVDRSAGVWFGTIPANDSPLGAGMAMTGSQPDAIYGWIAPTDGLSITTGVRFATAEQATEVLTQAQQMIQIVKLQAGDLGSLIDKAQMSTNDADMVVSIALSEAELGEVVDTVGTMFGGMFGMP